MDYHLEITKRGNYVDLFIYFLGVEGIISKHFFFYVLNFPKRYVLDLRWKEKQKMIKKGKDGIIKYVTNCIIYLYYQSVVS